MFAAGAFEEGAETLEFDDSAWRVLDLPHDWSVEELSPPPGQSSGAGSLWEPDP